MAEDDRPVIDQIQSRAVGYMGKELSPGEMAAEFAKWDIGERVKALEDIKAEGGGQLSLREAARRHVYERALRNTHEALRKADR